MPQSLTYPGVYIEEVPSGVRTITGVATSIAAFVDTFRRGPVNEAVQIFSLADFEREFGGLDRQSEASYGIQQFFLNGGSQAWVVRVASNAATAASVQLDQSYGANPTAILRVRAARNIRGESADNPGIWGNALRLEVDYDTSPPNDLAAGVTEEPAELFNLTVHELFPLGGPLRIMRSEVFRNLTVRADVPNNAIAVVNESSNLVQLGPGAAVPSPFVATFRPAATATQGGGLPVAPNIPVSGSSFNVDAGSGDKPVTLTYATAPTDYASLRPFLEDAIRAADTGDPLLAGAIVQLVGRGTQDSRYRFRVIAGRGGPNFAADATLTFSGATADNLGLTGASVTVGPQMLPLSGGVDSGLPGAPELRGSPAGKTGIHALEDADLFNLLCIPRAAALGPTDMRAVVSDAEAYCEKRRAFMIVDIPDAIDTLAEMQTWAMQNGTLQHKNAAVYFPRPQIADPLNGYRLRSVGASGTIAGLCAATDSARGVWKAPAGIDARLRNVQGLPYTLTDQENGVLNPIGVNCLRSFTAYGSVAWGARTMEGNDQRASEWKYIPVRRLALYIEESLYRGTQWVVFEPNDEPLWAQVRLNVGAFMNNLFRQGAFQGTTPRDAYFVKCDAETTTQNDRNLGVINVLVGFAPLKPAEFVVIKLQQMAGQIQT